MLWLREAIGRKGEKKMALRGAIWCGNHLISHRMDTKELIKGWSGTIKYLSITTLKCLKDSPLSLDLSDLSNNTTSTMSKQVRISLNIINGIG